MPAPFGDEYWALWAAEYVELAKQPGLYFPNVVMASKRGMDNKKVATAVFRLRRDGFLTEHTKRSERPELTQKTKDILERIGRKERAPVLFNIEVFAESKAEALSELWDVIQQLEHWDDRTGEPFQYRPARLRNLGMEDGKTPE